MKYIKTYENIKEDNIEHEDAYYGKFVICKENGHINTFLNNNVGKIIGYDFTNSPSIYKIQYDYIPEEYKKYFFKKNYRYFSLSQIITVADTKNEVELSINLNKYNL